MLSVPANSTRTLDDRLRGLLDKHAGKVSAAVEHLPTGESFAWHADRPMPTASLIKLPVMVAAYHAATEGGLDFDARLTLSEDDMVPGSGVLTPNFSPGP